METATASVLVSGAVGLGGLLSPFAWRRREQAREDARRRDQRFEELRAVVDAACVALVDASERMPSAQDVDRPDCARHLGDRLDDAAHEVYLAGTRMAARLGADHEIVRRYDGIWKSVHGMVGVLRRWADEGTLARDELGDLQEAFATARDEFFDASARRIGPERA
jgi:hypothetical protein